MLLPFVVCIIPSAWLLLISIVAIIFVFNRISGIMGALKSYDLSQRILFSGIFAVLSNTNFLHTKFYSDFLDIGIWRQWILTLEVFGGFEYRFTKVAFSKAIIIRILSLRSVLQIGQLQGLKVTRSRRVQINLIVLAAPGLQAWKRTVLQADIWTHTIERRRAASIRHCTRKCKVHGSYEEFVAAHKFRVFICNTHR